MISSCFFKSQRTEYAKQHKPLPTNLFEVSNDKFSFEYR